MKSLKRNLTAASFVIVFGVSMFNYFGAKANETVVEWENVIDTDWDSCDGDTTPC